MPLLSVTEIVCGAFAPPGGQLEAPHAIVAVEPPAPPLLEPALLVPPLFEPPPVLLEPAVALLDPACAAPPFAFPPTDVALPPFDVAVVPPDVDVAPLDDAPPLDEPASPIGVDEVKPTSLFELHATDA
ncbi:MAG TPA: hypothetical protein VGM44_09170, partial [Polyangiaceae bacterium]